MVPLRASQSTPAGISIFFGSTSIGSSGYSSGRMQGMLAVPLAQVMVRMFLSSLVSNFTGWVGSSLKELVSRSAGTAIRPSSPTSSMSIIVFKVVSWSEPVIVRLLPSNSRRKFSSIGSELFCGTTLETDSKACKKSVLVAENLISIKLNSTNIVKLIQNTAYSSVVIPKI